MVGQGAREEKGEKKGEALLAIPPSQITEENKRIQEKSGPTRFADSPPRDAKVTPQYKAAGTGQKVCGAM